MLCEVPQTLICDHVTLHIKGTDVGYSTPIISSNYDYYGKATWKFTYSSVKANHCSTYGSSQSTLMPLLQFWEDLCVRNKDYSSTGNREPVKEERIEGIFHFEVKVMT